MYTIFGSNGFIGSELMKYLKEQDSKVYVPKRNQKKFKKNLGNVIYCVGSDNWKKFPEQGFESNLGHLKEILFNNKFKSFLFLSSTRIYVNNKSTKENSFIKINSSNQNDFYNLLKLTSESICLNTNKQNIKIIRLSNVLGNNFDSPLVFPSLVRDAIKKNEITLFINKNSTKDYIHINDVINLIFKIIKFGKKKIYNLASGKNITLLKIAKLIQKQTMCKIKFKNQFTLIEEPKININSIKKEFKFKPKENIKQQIENIIENFKKNLISN